jgi:hypothetical protein
MFVRYPPGKIRYEGDRPVVRVAASRLRLVDLPLGPPTSLARSRRGPGRQATSGRGKVPTAGRARHARRRRIGQELGR